MHSKAESLQKKFENFCTNLCKILIITCSKSFFNLLVLSSYFHYFDVKKYVILEFWFLHGYVIISNAKIDYFLPLEIRNEKCSFSHLSLWTFFDKNISLIISFIIIWIFFISYSNLKVLHLTIRPYVEGGSISEFFSLWLQSPKKCAKSLSWLRINFR